MIPYQGQRNQELRQCLNDKTVPQLDLIVHDESPFVSAVVIGARQGPEENQAIGHLGKAHLGMSYRKRGRMFLSVGKIRSVMKRCDGLLTSWLLLDLFLFYQNANILHLRHLCQPLSPRPPSLVRDKVIKKNNSSAVTASDLCFSLFFF